MLSSSQVGQTGRHRQTVCLPGKSQANTLLLFACDWPVDANAGVCVCVTGRRGFGSHGEGGLHHADEEAHHEVAEGEVAGPWQQGRETPAV